MFMKKMLKKDKIYVNIDLGFTEFLGVHAHWVRRVRNFSNILETGTFV